MATELSREMKKIKIIVGENEKEYQFKHAIIHGLEQGEEGRLVSLICGYKNIEDFSMVYANCIVECYRFLQENYDGEDTDVFTSLKEFTENIFEGIKKGDFNEAVQDVIYENL